MSYLVLQFWGGLFYLMNKICFSQAERSLNSNSRRTWQISAWVAYLAGLPVWVIVFISENNWIAAGVEAGGAPSMIMGLIIAKNASTQSPGWLDYLSRIMVILGLLISFYEFGGLTVLTQYLELGISAGFLMGTYFLAKNEGAGYLWLMLGNLACSVLMGIQGYWILSIQQILSFVFVMDAFRSKINQPVFYK